MSVPSSVLNTLPKDVLIYLFETIQMKQKHENQMLRDIVNNCECVITRRFKCQECDHLLLFYNRARTSRGETCCGIGSQCVHCERYWCVYHKNKANLYKLQHINDSTYNCGPVCDNCYDSYTSPDDFSSIEEFIKVQVV